MGYLCLQSCVEILKNRWHEQFVQQQCSLEFSNSVPNMLSSHITTKKLTFDFQQHNYM